MDYHLPLENNMLWVGTMNHDELCENALIKSNLTIDRYSKIVGTIENSISYINRDIGQRVWQATINYIKYYPLVIDALKNGSDDKIDKAMDIAFEDQFVQKIIPKLKGLEIEGYSREKCLNIVKEQLKEFNNGSLERDFKKDRGVRIFYKMLYQS
jgi:hypothetical protein